MKNKYDDIINLPRRISNTRKPMPIIDRAAQFSPFAALTGHDLAIEETRRVTEDRMELDEYMMESLNNKLRILIDRLKEYPEIKITYFQPDEKKSGGSYITAVGAIKRIDAYEGVIYMVDGIEIPLHQIIDIKGDVLTSG